MTEPRPPKQASEGIALANGFLERDMPPHRYAPAFGEMQRSKPAREGIIHRGLMEKRLPTRVSERVQLRAAVRHVADGESGRRTVRDRVRVSEKVHEVERPIGRRGVRSDVDAASGSPATA